MVSVYHAASILLCYWVQYCGSSSCSFSSCISIIFSLCPFFQIEILFSFYAPHLSNFGTFIKDLCRIITLLLLLLPLPHLQICHLRPIKEEKSRLQQHHYNRLKSLSLPLLYHIHHHI